VKFPADRREPVIIKSKIIVFSLINSPFFLDPGHWGSRFVEAVAEPREFPWGRVEEGKRPKDLFQAGGF
jgi:hypothetical protein